MSPWVCRYCRATVTGGIDLVDELRGRCPFCLMPVNGSVPTETWESKRKVRRRHVELEPAPEGWATSHPGHPLGVGMPLGATLREDGETHLEAWMRILRDDACAYCDERPDEGTVDHIEPRALRRHGLHNWTNMVGACSSCNGSKGARPLLLFLASRGVKQRRRDDQRQRRARRSGR